MTQPPPPPLPINENIELTDEQVQHNVSENDIERTEEYDGCSEAATVRVPVVGCLRAHGGTEHTVVHDLVPVLPRHYPEQNCHGVASIVEVGSPENKQTCVRTESLIQNCYEILET